jgi:hypothetical protein
MAGITNDGVLDTDSSGGGGGGTVSIGAGGATDAAVLNTSPVGTEYGVAVRLVGATGGGGPATIANGADVAEGSTADAAVITDTAGTLSGKLRGLVKWAFERMPVSLGQKIMADSFPVTLASNQSSLAVTGPLTDAELRAAAVPISAAALPLPSGGASSALQTTGNASLAAIDADLDVALSTRLADATFTGRINTLGQKSMANSTPVVLASDQAAIPVTSSESYYEIRLDESTSIITYVGQANPGSITSTANWQIKRLDSTTGLVVEWADGNSNFDNIWDNRAALSYS